MYELIPHTADIGLRVRAASLNALFEEAAIGFTSLIVPNLEAVRPAQSQTISLAATSIDHLLFDWLHELLFIFDTKHLVFSEFNVEVRDTNLHARASGEPLDAARHHLGSEIKAVTYQGFKLKKTDGEYLAEIVFDI